MIVLATLSMVDFRKLSIVILYLHEPDIRTEKVLKTHFAFQIYFDGYWRPIVMAIPEAQVAQSFRNGEETCLFFAHRGLKCTVRQMAPPLYIFAVLPSNSGILISGAVAG